MHSIQDVLLILPATEKDSTLNSLRNLSGKYSSGFVLRALVIISANCKVAAAVEVCTEYRITKLQIMLPGSLKLTLAC